MIEGNGPLYPPYYPYQPNFPTPNFSTSQVPPSFSLLPSTTPYCPPFHQSGENSTRNCGLVYCVYCGLWIRFLFCFLSLSFSKLQLTYFSQHILIPFPPDQIFNNMAEVTITGWNSRDVRFPTSLDKTGSDAMNAAGDYSAAYCILKTDSNFSGHGMVRLSPPQLPATLYKNPTNIPACRPSPSAAAMTSSAKQSTT